MMHYGLLAACLVGAASARSCECGPGNYSNFPSRPCDCLPCLRGTYQPETVKYDLDGMFTACLVCSPGRHATEPGSATCAACEGTNTYAPSAGWGTECLECDAGSVANENRTGCVACPPGTFWNLTLAGASCDLCPEGTFTSEAGGTLLACKTCPSVASNAKRTACLCDTDPAKAAHACPANWTCPAGPSSSTVDCAPV